MRRIRHRRQHDVAELNITAFMNLMVILVPFLLISAVFSQLTIIQLGLLPGEGGAAAQSEKPPLQLELVVREKALLLNNAGHGAIARFERQALGENLAPLSEALQKVKRRYPGESAITILAEPEIRYDTLIALMDAVRMHRISQGMNILEVELFPLISVGDAPPRREKGAGA